MPELREACRIKDSHNDTTFGKPIVKIIGSNCAWNGAESQGRRTDMGISNLASMAFRVATALFMALLLALPARAQQNNSQYSMQEIIDAGHGFFGSASGGLAKVVERAFESYGLPNGYILGQEGSGAFVAGLTYGEGTLNTKNAGQHSVFWQGPSLGLDWGGQGSRTMVLVYNLPDVNSLFDRFGGVSGSAYVIAGVGMQVNVSRNIVLVPIRTGVGARIGINAGYLKLTRNPTWNPF
jgi:hypothetical protein